MDEKKKVSSVKWKEKAKKRRKQVTNVKINKEAIKKRKNDKTVDKFFTEQQLMAGYNAWLETGNKSRVCESMLITRYLFEKFEKELLDHYDNLKEEDCPKYDNVGPAANPTYMNGGRNALEQIDLSTLRVYYEAGFDDRQIAAMFNISYKQFKDIQKGNPLIHKMHKTSKNILASKVFNKMTQKALGQEKRKRTHFTNYMGEVIQTEYVEEQLSDLNAQKLILANSEIDFKEKQEATNIDNKGSILETLEALENEDDYLGEDE